MEPDSKQVRRSSKDGWIFFISGLIGALIVGWIVFPNILYSKKNQPLNFSHASHGPESDAGLECQECHFFYEDGTFSGVPGIENCMECHEDPESPLGESPEEVKLLTDYIKPEKEIPWLIYSRQPDCVYFPHIAHVTMAEIECRVCHGDFDARKSPPVYKVNRLTGYSIDIWGRSIAGYKKKTWDRMKMDDCAQCHTQKGKENNNACFVCHK
jgi:menaquinone reductase, multiheme cytochrome c subunit